MKQTMIMLIVALAFSACNHKMYIGEGKGAQLENMWPVALEQATGETTFNALTGEPVLCFYIHKENRLMLFDSTMVINKIIYPARPLELIHTQRKWGSSKIWDIVLEGDTLGCITSVYIPTQPELQENNR